MVFLVLCFRPIRQNRPILELHQRFPIPLHAVRLQKLKTLARWILFLRLEHRLLSSFLGSQSSFGCIFMVFFYIFLLSKGDSWNPMDMKLIPIGCWLSEDKVFATNSSLSNTFLFVASPRLTSEICRNPLVSPPSREFLLFFPLICNNLRYTKKSQAFMLSTFVRTANNNA